MFVCGIESSCDECSCAIVRDGVDIIAHVTATQIDFHKPFKGVVPEIASRKHIEMISSVFHQCLARAGGRGIGLSDIDGIAVTSRPGLSGSLAVGLSFAKGLSFALQRPFVGINHILAHLYAPQLAQKIPYPHLGLLVSGGHSLITRVDSYDSIKVLGRSIDDACGEAFDKVAKHYNLGYPGGGIIDKLAQKGYNKAFSFPFANLRKKGYNYDLSYSGLKNAVINQTDTFWDGKSEKSIENICASFQRVAIDSLLRKLERAVRDSGVHTIVAGGGVVANSYLRRALASRQEYRVYLSPLELCTDNGAMIAGIGYHYLADGRSSNMNHGVRARVNEFKKSMASEK